MKRIVLSLILTICASIYAAEPKTIRLNFADNESLDLPQDYMPILNQSETIKNALESTQEAPIDLYTIKKDIFETIVPYMSILANQELQGEQKKLDLSLLSSSLSDQKLAAVMQASDFLNIPSLTDVTIDQLADRLLKTDKLQRFIDDPEYLQKLNLNPVVEEEIARAMQALTKTAGIRATILQNVNVPYKVLYSQTGSFLSAAFSPDGKLLAIGSVGGNVSVFNILTGALTHSLVGHAGVTSITFSPDGKLLATGSADGDIRIFNVATGALIRALTGHDGWIRSITFSPDGKLLATGSFDGTARIWNVATGAEVHMVTGRTSEVSSAVVFSPDGKLLATGSSEGDIRIWNVETGTLVHTLAGQNFRLVLSVAFSPNGKLLATGSVNGIARIWNVETGTLVHTITGYTDEVYTAEAFSPGGKLLATGSFDGIARIWNVAIGMETGSLVHVLTGHSTTYSISSVAFSPDENLLATASKDGTARIWSLENILQMQTKFQHLSLEQLLLLVSGYEQREAQKISLVEHPHLRAIYNSLDPSIQNLVKGWFISESPSMIVKMWQWLKGKR